MKYKLTITTEDGREFTQEGNAFEPFNFRLQNSLKEVEVLSKESQAAWEYFGWTYQPRVTRTLQNKSGFGPVPQPMFAPPNFRSGNAVSLNRPEVPKWPTS